LPNYPLPEADAYIKELEARVEVHLSSRAAHDAAPARTRSGTAALKNPEVAEIEHLRRELNERAKLIEAKEKLRLDSQKKFDKETEERKKLDLERELTYLNREKELNHKLKSYIDCSRTEVDCPVRHYSTRNGTRRTHKLRTLFLDSQIISRRDAGYMHSSDYSHRLKLRSRVMR